MSDGQLILVTGVLLAAGLTGALLAGRLRLPGLLLFLGAGMAIGSDGTGWIEFGDYEAARTIGIVALALILFEGGMTAGWGEIRPVLRPAISLALVGTAVTAITTGLLASWLLGIDTLEGLLLGAVVASTDGAAIFSLLRGSTLERRLARTLEGESGLNDPVAVLFVLGFIEWIQKPHYGLLDLAGLFVQQLAIGLAAGLIIGFGAREAIRRVRLPSAGLFPVASIAAAALAYGAADSLHGSGFLAVYLAGLVLGSGASPARRTMVTFHEGLAAVAQMGLFFTLGLLVFPNKLGSVAVDGTLIALAVVFLTRPLAVFVSTAFQGFSWREQAVLSAAGLRGAVPVVLATFPVIAGVEDSKQLFNIVFFAVLVSTLLQGTTFEWLAQRFGLTTDESAMPSPLADPGTMRSLGAEVMEFPVGAGYAVVGHRVRDLGMPRDALLNVVVRGEQAIPPRGSTRVEAGDRLHVLVRQESAVEFRRLMRRWREGPIGPPPRPPRPLRSSPALFTTRPWREEDGDAGRPQSVHGIAVVEQLRTRRDRAGALVVLADGRYAFTGATLAVGSRPALTHAAHRRLATATDEAERAWLREVIGAVAGEH